MKRQILFTIAALVFVTAAPAAADTLPCTMNGVSYPVGFQGMWTVRNGEYQTWLSKAKAAGWSLVGTPVKFKGTTTATLRCVGLTVTQPPPPPPPPPPPTTTVGPTAAITCPAGAVDILPGQSIPLVVNANPGGTAFCLRAGTHSVLGPITPKTGDSFTGEYGAILDGTGWTTTSLDAAAFLALNQDIDYVTIQNLVIRNMPQKGIEAFYWMSDHWTIEHNEIAYNKDGVEFPPDSVIRYNYIHHNISKTPDAANPAERGGGYGAQRADRTLIEGNEIAYNGTEQKLTASVGVVFRNNFVHHNMGDGIWYDTNQSGASTIVEGNLIEDNGRAGVDFEANVGGIIRNNTIRRNAGDGVFIFRSRNVQITGNTIEGNLGGIEYFMDCQALVNGEDLQDVAAYDNHVQVSTMANGWAAAISAVNCDATQETAYLAGSKNLTFDRNAYTVPALSWTRYFFLGRMGWRDWPQWQATPQDANSTLSIP